MYRKKLMRACLTGLMVVTVATANVAPVFAAEAPAEETVQEPGAGAVGADVTVKFVDERGNVITRKTLASMKAFTIMRCWISIFQLDMKENQWEISMRYRVL